MSFESWIERGHVAVRLRKETPRHTALDLEIFGEVRSFDANCLRDLTNALCELMYRENAKQREVGV
jgi:hypothetical protein